MVHRIAVANYFPSIAYEPGESGDSPAVPAAHRVGSDRIGAGFAVEQEAGRTVDVGAEGAGMRGLEFGEDLGSGMAEAIAASTGNDRQRWVYRRKERKTSGGETAMMADFEDGALQIGLSRIR